MNYTKEIKVQELQEQSVILLNSLNLLFFPLMLQPTQWKRNYISDFPSQPLLLTVVLQTIPLYRN